MNVLMKALRATVTIGPHIKRWIWSDGKFQAKRAMILLIGLIILMIGYQFIPHEMPYIMESLDQLSDIIGYADDSLQ